MRSRVADGIRRRETPGESIRAVLWSSEYLCLGMLFIYTLLDLIFIQQVKQSFGILQINIIVMIGIVAFAAWYDQTGSRLAYIFRSFYVLPVGYMLYTQVHNYIPLVNPGNYDPLLASWDRAMFGVNPTEWIYQFSHPVLTEYFQVWYNLFQLMLIPTAIGFYVKNRMPEFRIYIMTLLFGFFVSYLLYFVMPAIGPRFEVHDFFSIDRELPGIFLTEPFRDLINAGNNITPDMKNPYDVVNRDCMPSGHTMMSVLGILMTWHYRSRWKWFVTIGGISVVVSTIYLRYHYMVDVIAGIVLALLVYLIHPWVVRAWKKMGIEV